MAWAAHADARACTHTHTNRDNFEMVAITLDRKVGNSDSLPDILTWYERVCTWRESGQGRDKSQITSLTSFKISAMKSYRALF